MRMALRGGCFWGDFGQLEAGMEQGFGEESGEWTFDMVRREHHERGKNTVGGHIIATLDAGLQSGGVLIRAPRAAIHHIPDRVHADGPYDPGQETFRDGGERRDRVCSGAHFRVQSLWWRSTGCTRRQPVPRVVLPLWSRLQAGRARESPWADRPVHRPGFCPGAGGIRVAGQRLPPTH